MNLGSEFRKLQDMQILKGTQECLNEGFLWFPLNSFCNFGVKKLKNHNESAELASGVCACL